MGKESVKAMLELAVEVARNNPKIPLHLIPMNTAKLQRLAVSLRKRYEVTCSHQWADTDNYRTATANLEQKALKLASELGVTLEYQQDPRGWPFILTVGEKQIPMG